MTDTGWAELAAAGFLPQDRMRGEELFARRTVQITAIGTCGVLGIVEGRQQSDYIVGLDFQNIRDGFLGAECECRRFEDTLGCKHVWAMIRALQTYDLPQPPVNRFELYECDCTEIEIGDPLRVRTSGDRDAAITRSESTKSLPRWQQQLQTLGLASAGRPDTSLPAFHQEVATNAQLWFVLALSDFADTEPLSVHIYRGKKKKDGNFGKPQLTSMPAYNVESLTDPAELKAFSFLETSETSAYGYRLYQSSSSQFSLQSKLLRPGLSALASSGRFVWTMEPSKYLSDPRPLTFDDGPLWSLKVSIAPHVGEDGVRRIRVTPSLVRDNPSTGSADGETESLKIDDVVGVSQDGVLLRSERIGLIGAEDVGLVRGFQQTGRIEVPLRNLPALMGQIIQWQTTQLDLHDDLPIEVRQPEPRPRLHLSSPENHQDSLRADVIMIYDDQEIDVLSPKSWFWDASDKTVLRRDRAAEDRRLAQLPVNCFRRGPLEGHVSLLRKELPDTVTELTSLGWEIVADGNVMKRAGGFHIEVESGQDWFDVHANADFGGQVVSLPELLLAQRKGQHYIVLDDGSHGILPQEWLAKFGDLEKTGTVQDDAIRFTQTQALLLDAMLAEHQDVSLDRAFQAWCEKLNGFEGIAPADAPEGFQGRLREYQQLGLGWLNFLNEFRLGGCLADDMGLGKTIQVLSLLQQRQTRERDPDESRLPSLIVVPKSLIFNWIDEASKFTPNLKVASYHGTERTELRDSLGDYDAIVTTYGTLRNDAAILRNVAFDYVILDEAQAIKNPQSQASKASRLMNARHRLAMTGTPVENHLGDLWSLFDFLNPGMLGNSLGSARMGATAEDEQHTNHVAKALRPFILRRTKKQVLTELPDKTEQTLYCDMEPKQRKLYNELRDHYRNLITGKVAEVGLAKSKIHVLEALLRLRQAACDPRLVNAGCGVTGAKLDLIVEQLGELVDENHKALVFSQFTSLLSLLRAELDAKGWRYEYLDGKTLKRDQHVQRFQEDESCHLFLISLKAGGHGLNLTAADYVFILDPWWNPAVEAQAIDRAHRMGQTKSVNAYRMICRDTVEEKIVDLQASKRKLADAIISQKQSLISELTSDDLRMLFE